MENIEKFLEEKRKYRKKTTVITKNKGVFDVFFRQLVLCMGLLTMMFTFRLFPVTKTLFYNVQAVISEDYSNDIVAVFNNFGENLFDKT